ncbi:argH [Gossypium australe]|uniref:ArgH n=1 Tax=Gossypium australe TaxID=47621 RepID=A0A5B6UDE7_9ROSI|nr:argH [Gossypium australe]
MESLYAKLYDKYDKLKKRKLSEMDDIHRDQEEKFLNYVRVKKIEEMERNLFYFISMDCDHPLRDYHLMEAAEELIQHLKSENDKLNAEVNELRSEVVSLMSSKDKQCVEYQKLLIEESQKYCFFSSMHKALDKVVGIVIEFSLQGRLYVMMKGSGLSIGSGKGWTTSLGLEWDGLDELKGTDKESSKKLSVVQFDVRMGVFKLYKALSDEVTRLQNLHEEGRVKGGRRDIIPTVSPGSAQVAPQSVSGDSTQIMTRKRRRNSAAETEDSIVSPGSAKRKVATLSAFTEELPEKALSSEVLAHAQLPECCKGRTSANATDCGTCLFQALIECLVGMKISTVNQTEGLCILALHQSSGYSFSLTWINKTSGEEAELMYRVLSLGTFERVAPEWMRDVIMFSTNMCPIFFERLARVIKLHC